MSQSFFVGAGRRRYDNGMILNIYTPVPAEAQSRNTATEAQPWEGLYWTSDAGSGAQSPAFYFWFEKKTSGGNVEYDVPYARANGMQVRCVREK